MVEDNEYYVDIILQTVVVERMLKEQWFNSVRVLNESLAAIEV